MSRTFKDMYRQKPGRSWRETNRQLRMPLVRGSILRGGSKTSLGFYPVIQHEVTINGEHLPDLRST
jgi:hypothetical protein